MRDYIEVIIATEPVSEEFAELVMAEIESLGFESFVYEDDVLKAYIPVDSFDERRLRVILGGFDNSTEFSYSYIVNHIGYQNWNALWESSFDPVIIGNKCVIKASFHKDLPRARYNITIDPKMAFGTGHHNTTALMVESMFALDIKGRDVLDIGTGTGILAILAAKMGASKVHAIDIDITAVESTRENIVKNRVARRITPMCGDASLLVSAKYDLILANINRNILLGDMSTYSMALRSGGTLLISGFYEEDIDMLLIEAKKYSLDLVDKKIRDRWSVIELKSLEFI